MSISLDMTLNEFYSQICRCDRDASNFLTELNRLNQFQAVGVVTMDNINYYLKNASKRARERVFMRVKQNLEALDVEREIHRAFLQLYGEN